jgi:hypothetical protein
MALKSGFSTSFFDEEEKDNEQCCLALYLNETTRFWRLGLI